MKIVADENIPHVASRFGHLGEVCLQPGHTLDAGAVRGADVLLVRSVTRIDEALLGGSNVRFVGSATIGTDHVDTAYLRRSGIAFAYAPGSNADSVVEYVAASLLLLATRRGRQLRGRTVGIVGCGNIGSRLARRLPALGLRVLKNDPPLAAEAEAAERPHDFVPLARILDEADVVTLHVPLVREGPYATVHLFDEPTLRRLKPGAWLINSSRGAAVSNEALGRVLAEGHLGGVGLDVWEQEPTPDPDLLRRVDVATPHIAGYSYDGKRAGTEMLYRALLAFLGDAGADDAPSPADPDGPDALRLTPPDPALPETDWLHAAVRQMYDLAADDTRLRGLLGLPSTEHGAYFRGLRRDYPRRRTFSRYAMSATLVPPPYEAAAREGLLLER